MTATASYLWKMFAIEGSLLLQGFTGNVILYRSMERLHRSEIACVKCGIVSTCHWLVHWDMSLRSMTPRHPSRTSLFGAIKGTFSSSSSTMNGPASEWRYKLESRLLVTQKDRPEKMFCVSARLVVISLRQLEHHNKGIGLVLAYSSSGCRTIMCG